MRWENLAFVGLIGLYLIPLWLGKYFLTGDGPCHLYNAHILLDLFSGRQVDFYGKWFEVNPAPEPNWFGHAVLMVLMQVFPPFLAEKLLLSSYVIFYAIALRMLLKTLHPSAEYLVFLGFPFIYQYTFQMGFYNYSFSILFFFVILRYGWKIHDQLTLLRLMGLGALLLLQYFTHPVGYFYSLAGLGLYLLSFLRKDSLTEVSQKGVKVLLAALPSLILLGDYFFRKGGIRPEAGSESLFSLLLNFGKFSSLILLVEEERFISIALALTIGMLGGYAFYKRIRLQEGKQGDLFLGLWVIALITYFGNIGGLAGAGVLSVRLQFLPYLMMLLWLAFFPMGDRWKERIVIVGLVLSSSFIVIRLPAYLRTQDALDEYLAVAPYIEPGHSVLPLSYDHRGRTSTGDEVANRIWLFFHVADYIAVDKPLIMLDNYEANTGYFPLTWIPGQNPYIQLAAGQGLEGRPPGIQLNDDQQVDYILTWCEDFEYKAHPELMDLHRQMKEKQYEKVGESPQGLVKVYRKSAGITGTKNPARGREKKYILPREQKEF